MVRRLLRVSVLGLLTFNLLLGGSPAGTSAVHADPNASSVTPLESSLSPASQQFELRSTIAFASSRDTPTARGGEALQNAAEIYLMDGDGTNQRRVTNNTSYDAFPDLSPDGKKIVFDSNRDRAAGEPVNTTDLFVMNADGTEQTRLTQGGSSTWSANGKLVAFHASKSGIGKPIAPNPSAATEDSDIWVVNVDECLEVKQAHGVDDCRKVDGPHVKNITNTQGFIEDDPDWSPDGTKIVFTRHNVGDNPQNATSAEIYAMTVSPDGTPDSTKQLQQLTTNSVEERGPAWSPNGARIAFMRRIPDSEIWVMNADGTNGVQLNPDNDVFDGTPTWSPDGARIAFIRAIRLGVQALFSMNAADGSGLHQLTDTPVQDPIQNTSPSWGVLRVHVGAPAVTQPARAPAAAPVPKR